MSKLRMAPVQSEEIDLFRRDISEEHMAQEDVLMIYDDNDIVDVGAWYFDSFYFTTNKKRVCHWGLSYVLKYYEAPSQLSPLLL